MYFVLIILFSRRMMEQTKTTVDRNSLTLDIDRTMEVRKSQVNLLNAVTAESNLSLNEVRFYLYLKTGY